MYHYAGNNPVRYVDPDGNEQTDAQKKQVKLFSDLAACDYNFKEQLRNNIYIEIQRSPNDTENSKMYYQSTAKIIAFGVELNQVPVQSTADHPELEEGDGTLSPGIYNGVLKEKSGSYLCAILIKAPDFFIHPDQITNPGKQQERLKEGKSNGPFTQPYSKGCQIMRLKDFNETINILHQLHLSSNDVDTINIKIIGADNE